MRLLVNFGLIAALLPSEGATWRYSERARIQKTEAHCPVITEAPQIIQILEPIRFIVFCYLLSYSKLQKNNEIQYLNRSKLFLILFNPFGGINQ